MKKIIFLFSLFAAINTASAQKWADKVNPWGGINGVQFFIGGNSNLEAGANYVISSFPKKDPGFGGLAGFQNISIGMSAKGNKKHTYFGPHIAYQRALAILALQSSIEYHTSFKDNYLRFTPKAGLSFFGFVNVVCGYNLYLINNTDNTTQSPFTITAQLTMLNGF